MIELILLGIVVGVLSGFFGIGGGTILIPILLFLGIPTKDAIGISVVQMVFSSVFGSYLNNKKGTLDVPMVVVIGLGGFVGALLSGYITSSFSDFTLELIFLSFSLFALLRMFFKPKESKGQKDVSKVVLFLIGVPIGTLSMTIGVGGSIILVPILVGFLHVDLKRATSAGLFFVVFSSVAGFISHMQVGDLDYQSGIIIGLASMIGVYVGVHLKDRVTPILQKRLLVGFYMLIVLYIVKRIFF